MSIRLRMIAIVVALVLVTGGWFLLSFKPTSADITEVKSQVEATKAEVAQLEAKLRELQALKANEKQLRADFARLSKGLPKKPGVSDYIRQVQRIANESNLSFVSIAPTPPTDLASTAATPSGTPLLLKKIGIGVNAEGGFFEVENFVAKLERLERAMRIDTFSLNRGGQNGLTLGIQGQIFMNLPAPPAPPTPAAGTTTPGASPAPGASASPAPTTTPAV